MMDPTPHDPDSTPLSLDAVLRDILPEIKLSLGEQIDAENARALPSRYARLLPETLLVVTLRTDVAEAITPIAADIEQELTGSCTRHGSLYDRVYRVQLRRAEDRDAPLFTVAAHAGQELASPPGAAPDPFEAPRPAPAAEPAAAGDTLHVSLPVTDPDATRVEGLEQGSGWEPGRWILVVEDLDGEEQEVFRLAEPFTTVGRRSDDPQLRVAVSLGSAPHVSRRQLALQWDGEEPAPGFRVYNLGLNPLHLPGSEVPGARLGRGALDLGAVGPAHTARVGVETPIRIGDHGPVLRLREVPADADDPEATRFE